MVCPLGNGQSWTAEGSGRKGGDWGGPPPLDRALSTLQITVFLWVPEGGQSVPSAVMTEPYIAGAGTVKRVHSFFILDLDFSDAK